MGGIDAVHVQTIVRFGVTEFFRLAQGIGKARPFLGHAAEDVVAGAVDDAVQTEQLVGDEAFAECLEHGDAAGHAGLKINRDVRLLGEGDELLAPLGKERLVGGDEGFAGGEGGLGHLEGFRGVAEKLHHDLDGGMGDDGFPVRHRRDRKTFPLLGRIAHGDGADLEADPQALLEQTIGCGKVPDQTGTDRAATHQSNAHCLHLLI